MNDLIYQPIKNEDFYNYEHFYKEPISLEIKKYKESLTRNKILNKFK